MSEDKEAVVRILAFGYESRFKYTRSILVLDTAVVTLAISLLL